MASLLIFGIFDCGIWRTTQEIHDTLCKLALEITKHVNSFYPYPLDEVGVDLAIDRNEHIWLYEVNAGPQTKTMSGRGLKIQLLYAHYIANKAATKELTDKLYLLLVSFCTALDMLVNDLDKSNGVGLFTSFSNGFLN